MPEVTPKKLTSPKRTINMRVDAEAYDKVRAYARQNQVTISWVVNRLLIQVAEKMNAPTL